MLALCCSEPVVRSLNPVERKSIAYAALSTTSDWLLASWFQRRTLSLGFWGSLNRSRIVQSLLASRDFITIKAGLNPRNIKDG